MDYTTYFDLNNIPIPSDLDGILHYFLEEGIVVKQDNGLYAISNLGALLFAKNILSFPKISRKAIRIVQYDGNFPIACTKNRSI